MIPDPDVVRIRESYQTECECIWIRILEEEEGNLADMEQEDVVNSAQHGAGSVPAGNSSANLPEGHNGSARERLNDVNDEIPDQADAPRNAGRSSSPDHSASLPGGDGDDSCRQNKRNAEARERVMMKALDLIEESNEVLQLADGSSLGRYVFGSEISYNKAPPRLPGLGC
jgi:hypothetical protein